MADGSTKPTKWKRVAAVAGILIVLGIAFIAFFVWPTRVPDVLMQSEPNAVVALEAAGLRVGERTEVATGSVGSGLVVAQRPAGGSMLIRGRSVDLAVAVPPAPTAVPDVTGMDALAAAEVLGEAGFTARTVDVFDADAAQGEVLAQVPAPATMWISGRVVALGVSAGPDDGTGVAVPDLTGVRLTDALKQLEAVGLKGEGFVVDPEDADSEVLQQLPTAATMVRPGTTVLILADNP